MLQVLGSFLLLSIRHYPLYSPLFFFLHTTSATCMPNGDVMPAIKHVEIGKLSLVKYQPAMYFFPLLRYYLSAFYSPTSSAWSTCTVLVPLNNVGNQTY